MLPSFMKLKRRLAPVTKAIFLKISFFGFVIAAIPAANGTDILSAGDIAIIARDADVDNFAFTILNHIEAGQVLYFTDNGWTGSGFRDVSDIDGNGGEQLVKWTADTFLSAGTTVTAYADVSGKYTWTDDGSIPGATSGSFSGLTLNASGEQIYAFATSATNDQAFMTSSMTHLYVLDDTNGFEDATSTQSGNITPGLTLGITAITVNADDGDGDDFLTVNSSILSGATKSKSEWLSAFGTTSNYTEASSGALPTTTLNVSTTNTSALVFGGTASTVTLSGPSSSGGLNFTTTGYELAGSSVNTVTLTSGNVNVTLGSATVSAPIVGSSAVTKTGAGTLVLNGINSYSGTTTIKAGTLALGLDGTISDSNSIVAGDSGSSGTILDASAKSGFSIEDTQTLSGIGTVNVGVGKTLTVTGTHSVGNLGTDGGIGTQGITGNLNYSSSIFNWDLNPSAITPDPGVVVNDGNYDKVTATGTIIGESSVFNVVLGAGKSFADAFWNSNKSWNDVFTGSSAPNLASIFTTFSGSGVAVDGVVFGQGQFTFSSSTLTWTAVPEPTSALAGLLITAGLLRRRRRVA
jgi:autotransporter-associated beta strand protein